MKLYRSSVVGASLQKGTFLLKRESITDIDVVMLNKLVFNVHDGEVDSFNATATDAQFITDTTPRQLLPFE